MPDRAAADIVLINPRFEASYWGLEHALSIFGKRAAMPVASLPLLAALTPPGHHVTPLGYGGSCYLNNAAVAAEALRAAGHERVAVIDIDAHHGNGTQAVFWERADVRYGSLHVDPAAGWFPHFLGLARERGGGAGEGANLNVPLPPGTGDELWLEAIREAARAARNHGAGALVVALGVDAAAADTLLLTVPNQLGVDYNAHVLESVLALAPELGWR